MQRLFSLIALISVVVASTVLFHPDQLSEAQVSSYGYAIAVQNDTEVQINVLGNDPLGELIVGPTLTVPENYRLIDAAASPTGTHIALGFWAGSWGIKTIYILDMLNGGIQEIGNFVPLIQDIQDTTELFPSYLWSPNGSLLAYVGHPVDEDGATDLYIYSLDTQSVFNLTQDVRYQYRVAWSQDGQYLSILSGSRECQVDTCETMLEIWDVAQSQQVRTINLLDYLAFPLLPHTAACYFDWSPDNAHLSFMMGCEILSGRFFDMYVLDVHTGEVDQLTEFAAPSIVWDSPVQFGAIFSSAWYDGQTLLISAWVRPIFPNLGIDAIYTSQTAIYQTSQWNETVLMSDLAMEWALNPATQQLAYRAATYSVDRNLYQPGQIGIQIARLENNELVVQRQAPMGCHLAWSPDGTMLAYGDYQSVSGTCLGLEGFVLVDNTTGEIVEVPLPTGNVVLGGWIAQLDR